MQEPFDGERFKYSLLLVLCNRLVTVVVAASLLVANGQDIRPVAPPQAYAAVSVSNVVATFCQYEALKHVSFPLQTLGKCAKMIPVMVWGTIIMRKRYSKLINTNALAVGNLSPIIIYNMLTKFSFPPTDAKDYGVAAAVTAGCTIFLMTGEIKSKHASSDSSIFGIMLMLGYLGFDGFTSTFQDKLFKGYQMTIYNQIMYVQSFSAGFSILGMLTAGQLGEAFSFVMRHPDALSSILTLSAAATIGQLFISHTIKTYGALLFATVMTTRQFISILLSCVLFAHPLTGGQWMGTAAVFGALYYKTLSKKDGGHGGGGDKVAVAKTVEGEVADAAERVPLTATTAAAEPGLPK
jgi:solute carrier family 35 (adenosine 3'-phospho 5'-phosphosulfate transporter), member B2